MQFTKISIKKWQQFENVEIEFHDRLTVLTGANGSGKTSILSLLARHFGWETHSLATPKKDVISKAWKWFTGLWSEEEKEDSNQIIGELTYSDGTKADLVIPQHDSAQYQIQIKGQQNAECFFIPSHRSVFRYQAITQIPTQNSIDKAHAFSKVSNSNRSRYFGGNDHSSSFYIKETLVGWNIFGRGNEDMEATEKLLEHYKGFENTLKIVLPKELGFKKFAIKNFEVILECDSGDFVIDAASGGISAIIDMAWQIYMYFTDVNKKFTVIIDEIENHLHPTMQRRILSDFVKAFPQASFIVSTHSPLIVGSVKESNVYALRHNINKKVVTERLDLLNKARTAAEILDEVLGVSFTMPIWAEEKLKEVVNKYSKNDLTNPQSFKDLRSELSDIGLEKLVPDAITSVVDIKNHEENQ